jgi:nucleoside-diphosphate-sugar epimerase
MAYLFADYPPIVRSIAYAIVLALHPAAANRVYNIGEAHTPTIAERLQNLPSSTVPLVTANAYDFPHDIAYDTTRIRSELGYKERIPYGEGFKRTLRTTQA